MKPHYIASDIHLGAVPPETERSFLRFLAHVGEHGSALLLPGDLFDFWFEWGQIIHGAHFRVLAALSELVEAGLPVAMVGGNHDAWGGRFLRDEVGVLFHPDALRLEIAGRPALVAHGDGVGGGDLRYRALKAVLRSRLAIAGFRALHPELGLRLARLVSGTEGRAGAAPDVRGRARVIARWARSRLVEDPQLAFVVCGHAHIPAITAVDEGRYYLNPGDWVHHASYLTVRAGEGPVLRRWDGDAPAA